MKYILLTVGEYIALNNEISVFKGYDLSKSTQRVYPVNPSLAKINIVYEDEKEVSFDLRCVVKVSVRDQEIYSGIFSKYELIRKSEVNFTDIQLNEIEAEGLSTEQIDWYLNHYSEVGDKSVEAINLETLPRSIDSDIAVNKLVYQDNITIITNE